MISPRPRTQKVSGWLRGRATNYTVGLLVLLIVGVGYLVLSLELPAGEVGRPAEGLLPRMIGVLIVVSSVLALVGARNASPSSSHTADEDDEPAEHDFGEAAWRVPAVAVGVLLYVVLAPRAGHLVTSSVVSFLVLTLLAARPRWQMALVSVGFGAATYALFTEFLDVALPLGSWWS